MPPNAAFSAWERPGTAAKPGRKRKFSVPLIELVRPDGYWPQPLTIEQAFELLRWMVKTGDDGKFSTPLSYGHAGVPELLNGASTVSNDGVTPITSREDLRRRFHYALLSRPQSDGQILWRRKFGIDVGKTATVESATYTPFQGAKHLGWRSETDIQETLEKICTGHVGDTMAVSLNESHPDDLHLHGVGVSVDPDGFCFVLTYGEMPSVAGASHWSDIIAKTRQGESFLDTMARARDVFECLVLGEPNGCDLGDMRHNRPDHVDPQIEALGQPAPSAR